MLRLLHYPSGMNLKMSLLYATLYFVLWNSTRRCSHRNDKSSIAHTYLVQKDCGTCISWDTNSFKFCPTWAVYCTDNVTLPLFVVLFSAYNRLLSLYSYPLSSSRLWSRHSFHQPASTHSVRRKCFIFLLLLLSGNIELNPGPDINCLDTPSDFKSRSGLGVFHLNVRSLLPKLDLVI